MISTSIEGNFLNFFFFSSITIGREDIYIGYKGKSKSERENRVIGPNLKSKYVLG